MIKLSLVKSFFITVFVLFVFQDKSIFDIARTGTVEELKQLVLDNEDVINKSDENGNYPLTIACYHGNYEVALYLAKHVEDVDINSSYGTPLLAAVFKQHEKLSKELLILGAKPNTKDKNGSTCLHYAVMLGNESLVKLLITYKADSSIRDNRKKTALDYALITGDENIIKLLQE